MLLLVKEPTTEKMYINKQLKMKKYPHCYFESPDKRFYQRDWNTVFYCNAPTAGTFPFLVFL